MFPLPITARKARASEIVRRHCCLLTLLIVTNTVFVSAIRGQSKCQPPAVPPNPANLFSEEQEMSLGDAVAAHIESSFQVIDDEEVIGYLGRLGQRLIAQVPATKFRFQFFVVDSYEVNAFTLPGGRIYVTRKLISFARNEDELAGVVAHELGHVLARHLANDMSALWREGLGVSQVGDRQDIFGKYQTFIDTFRLKPKIGEKLPREDRDQYAADMIGLYLMTSAGYDPQAQANFWDRYQETKGKTGSFFSNLFGTTRPEQKRLAEMLRQLAQLPPECKGQSSHPTQAEFQKWQSAVVSYKQFGRRVSLPGLVRNTKLDPPLRSTVYHMRFSQDGKYLLAQDDSGISILTREPLALLFRISAPNAYPAQFTADSRQVNLYTPNLRVETWDIATQALSSANEVVLRTSCLQTRLSPDGRTLACLDENASLLLIDVNANTQFFEKKDFTTPSYFELLTRVESIFTRGRVPEEGYLVNMSFSPDGRYFLAGDHSYVTGAFSSTSQDKAAGYDLHDKVVLPLTNDLKRVAIGGFAFLGSNKIVGHHFSETKKSGMYSFPDGAMIEAFEPPRSHFKSIARGDYLLIDGGGVYGGAVFDLKVKKYFRPGQERLMDVFEGTGAAETPNGELALYGLGGEPPKVLPIPENPLGRLYAVSLSPDLKYLALSGSVRGAVWDLTEGKMLVYIRGFRGASFAEDGLLYMDFPGQDANPRSIAHFDPVQKTVGRDAAIKSQSASQYGEVLIRTRPKAEIKDGKEVFDWSGGTTTFEAYDAKTYALLWSQEFNAGFPSYVPDGFFGTMVLAWWGDAKTVAAELKDDPALSKRLGSSKESEDKYFLKILDLKSGKTLGRLVVDTNRRSFKIVDAIATSDFLVAMDNQNRALVYSISSGKLLGRVFGSRATLNVAARLLCVENESGQLNFYDLDSFEKRGQLSFSDRIKMVRFSVDGKRLAVLTANQTVSTFDVAAISAPRP